MTRFRCDPAWWLPLAVFAAVGVVHALASPVAEPFKNGDETRHVMTGVFVRDAIVDWSVSTADPKDYAVRYYAQYPALGLLVWPPFFYLVEGLAMSLFGTSYLTARLVIYGFAALAGLYHYRLVLRTHGREVAFLSLALFAFAPLVFDCSGYVLLEVPTLALVLGAIFHFERYLSDPRIRDVILACLLAALAALTRFDGIVLLPYVAIRIVATRKFRQLLRAPVLASVAAALALTVPYYLFTWQVYGKGIEAGAMTGTASFATGFLSIRNFRIYPSFIPDQMGWFAAVVATLGLLAAIVRDRSRSSPYLAAFAATYLTFSLFAEPEWRHAIYWVPALSLFAASLVIGLARHWGRTVTGIVAAALIAYTGWVSVTDGGWWLRGNEAAAQYVAANASGERPVLVDSALNGGFIYSVRRADPHRKLWVLRGDKLFYAVLSDPHAQYQEYAADEAKVLALLHEYDPEFIVLEEPETMYDLPAARRLRQAVHRDPGRFKLEKVIPYETNHHVFQHGRLEIYRKMDRNPTPTKLISVPVLGMNRSLTAPR